MPSWEPLFSYNNGTYEPATESKSSPKILSSTVARLAEISFVGVGLAVQSPFLAAHPASISSNSLCRSLTNRTRRRVCQTPQGLPGRDMNNQQVRKQRSQVFGAFLHTGLL